MKKKNSFAVCMALCVCIPAFKADAHFLELIPSSDIVASSAEKKVELDIVFSHPMENGPAMEMSFPEEFFVVHQGKREDIADGLTVQKVDGKSAYKTSYDLKAPGDYVFAVAPAPYWEPAEEKLIIHYTKVVVNGFSEESGWDEPVRFPVEIDPLVRPYGLWTGNTFRGVVKHNGRPVPFAEIEVEYLNSDESVSIPADPYVTQVITADINGVFSYTMPLAGWWGFAALVEGDLREYEGKKVDVELGGLMWVHCVDMTRKNK